VKAQLTFHFVAVFRPSPLACTASSLDMDVTLPIRTPRVNRRSGAARSGKCPLTLDHSKIYLAPLLQLPGSASAGQRESEVKTADFFLSAWGAD
jgi:hypothetical protein